MDKKRQEELGLGLVELMREMLADSERYAKHFGNEGVIYSIPHNTLALAGEVGEFANIVKKIERGDLDIRDADVRMRLMMEWTDIFIYHMLIGGLIKVNPMMAYNYVRAENEKRFGQHD